MATSDKNNQKIDHLNVSERVAIGKQARKLAGRSSHVVFAPAADRVDPVTLLEQQAKTRAPELVPVRYGRMLASPFTFYRGAAMIMASDLASTPRTGLNVQCCGDAHLSNFGVFGSPERKLIFDLNDFDETLPGPWEWDVKRLAASMLVAGQSNGFAVKDQEQVVLDTVEEYRTTMREFAGMRTLDIWYSRLNIEDKLQELSPQLTKEMKTRTQRSIAKARTRDHISAFSKLTQVVDGERRFIADPPLIVPVDDIAQGYERDELFDGIHDLLIKYRRTLDPDRRQLLERFRLVDLARKVVGVGSVGTRAWIALLLGRDGQDPLILQFKEAEKSVFEGFVGKSKYRNSGQRVVVGQHLMQANSDIFLGWLHVQESLEGGAPRDYYARQLRDWKGSALVDEMAPRGLSHYGRLCGWTLARAHARSGDSVAIGAYLGKGDTFDRAIVEFSQAYGEQNERDYRALADAVASGRIVAQTDK